jgi:hypothetical protein
MSELLIHAVITGGLVLAALALRRYIRTHTLAKRPHHEDGVIRDFLRFTWDCREQIQGANNFKELEACELEIQFIEDTFRGLLLDTNIMTTKLDELRSYLAVRMASKTFS